MATTRVVIDVFKSFIGRFLPPHATQNASIWAMQRPGAWEIRSVNKKSILRTPLYYPFSPSLVAPTRTPTATGETCSAVRPPTLSQLQPDDTLRYVSSHNEFQQ